MEETKRTKRNWSWVFSLLSVVVAFLSLFLSLFPQFNTISNDYIEKANAGDVDSQVFLAEHYFDIGDISESVYWYKIASMHDGEYKGTALNNLAYLYVTCGAFDEHDLNFRERALKLFRQAAELGEVKAARNMYILLVSNPAEVFSSFYYEDELDWVKDFLKSYQALSEDLILYETGWVCIGTTTEIPRDGDTEEIRFVQTNVEFLYDSESCSTYWVYTYDIYKKVEESEIENIEPPDYSFISHFLQ